MEPIVAPRLNIVQKNGDEAVVRKQKLVVRDGGHSATLADPLGNWTKFPAIVGEQLIDVFVQEQVVQYLKGYPTQSHVSVVDDNKEKLLLIATNKFNNGELVDSKLRITDLDISKYENGIDL